MSTDLITAEPISPAPSPRVQGCLRPGDRSGVEGDGLEGAPTERSHVNRESTIGVNVVIADYVELTKPRIVVMILVTTVASAMVAMGGLVPPLELAWLLLGTAAVAGSAGGANQIWERVIDRRMTRTASRPLPGGRMTIARASWFTAALGVIGTGWLAFHFGLSPAAIGVITWLVYVLLYTPMKTRTAWNTTVGAISGALPILIGYTAAGGGLLDLTGWLLFGVLAAWQYPHFMAIAWMYRRQYGEAGFRMTTTIDPTGRWAGVQSILGSLGLVGCGIALTLVPGGWWWSVLGAVAVLASGLPMFAASCQFAAAPDDARARRLLRSSLLVLPAVLMIVTLRATI